MSNAFFRHLANASLCAAMAFAPFVQSGESVPQRLALATPPAKAQSHATSVAPQRAEPASSKNP